MTSVHTRYQVGDEPVHGYRLQQFIGKGGFGEVWEAKLSGGLRPVALKVVHGLGRGRSLEVDSLRRLLKIRDLDHAHLIRLDAFWFKDVKGEILDERAVDRLIDASPTAETQLWFGTGRQPDELIVVMELGEQTLFQRLQQVQQLGHAGLSIEELLPYMEGVASALDYLNVENHTQHCDIKPENILLVKGKAKVCDFGVLKSVEDVRLTGTGGFTPEFSAPEAAHNTFTPTFDEYSLAVTYAYLRLGRLPYIGVLDFAQLPHGRLPRNARFVDLQKLEQAKNEGLLDFSQFTPGERRVLSKATMPDWTERYETAGQMVAALKQAVQQQEPSVPHPMDSDQPSPLSPSAELPAAPRTPYDTGNPTPRTTRPAEPDLSVTHPYTNGTVSYRNADTEPADSTYDVKIVYQKGDRPVPGYRLIEFLGEGASGEVWKASAPGGVEIALKILSNLEQTLARKEFQSLKKIRNINHPNLTKIQGIWIKDEKGRLLNDASVETELGGSDEDGDQNAKTMVALSDTAALEQFRSSSHRFGSRAQLLIAMDLGSQTLLQRLKECQSHGLPGIPAKELLTYMKSAADALYYLNIERREKLQHCDIKPQNILIAAGRAKVCDFGLLKEVTDLKQSTTAAFTPYYVAPEVFLHNEYSTRVDQYSLAVTYAELRMGRVPYEADTAAHVAAAKLNGKLELSGIPKAERRVIRKATAINPDHRYDDIRMFVEALEAAVVRRRSFAPLIAVLMLLLVAAAGGLGWYAFHAPQFARVFRSHVAKQEFENAYDVLRTNFALQNEKYLNELRVPWQKQLADLAEAQPESPLTDNLVDEALANWDRFANFLNKSQFAADEPVLSARLHFATQIADRVEQTLDTDVLTDGLATKLGRMIAAIRQSQPPLDAQLDAHLQFAALRLQARLESNWPEIIGALGALPACPPLQQANYEALQVIAAYEAYRESPDVAKVYELPAVRDGLLRLCNSQNVSPWEHARLGAIEQEVAGALLKDVEARVLTEQVLQQWDACERLAVRLRLAEVTTELDKYPLPGNEAPSRERLQDLRSKLAKVPPQLDKEVERTRNDLTLLIDVLDPKLALREKVDHIAAARPKANQLHRVWQFLRAQLYQQVAALTADELDTLLAAWQPSAAMEAYKNDYSELRMLRWLRWPDSWKVLAENANTLSAMPDTLATFVNALGAEARFYRQGPAAQQEALREDVLLSAGRLRGTAALDSGPSAAVWRTYASYLQALGDVTAPAPREIDIQQLVELIVNPDAQWLLSPPRATGLRQQTSRAILLVFPTDGELLANEKPPAAVRDWLAALDALAAADAADISSSDMSAITALLSLDEPISGDSADLCDLTDQLLATVTSPTTAFGSRVIGLQIASARAYMRRATRSGDNDDYETAVKRFHIALTGVRDRSDELPDSIDGLILEPALQCLEQLELWNSQAHAASISNASALNFTEGEVSPLQQQAADLLTVKADLLEKELAPDAEFKLKLRAQAAQLDGTHARLIAWGKAVHSMQDSAAKAELLIKIAERALEQENSAQAHGLLGDGYWLAAKAACYSDREGRATSYGRAAKAFAEAATLARQAADPSEGLWHLRLSTALVPQSFWHGHDETLLTQAVAAAKRAREFPSVQVSETYIAEGNAYEDLAYYVYGERNLRRTAECFELAIGAFEQAKNTIAGDDVKQKAMIYLARCRFRRALHLPKDEIAARSSDLLQAADLDLAEVIEVAAPSLQSEAYALRSRVQHLGTERGMSGFSFEQADRFAVFAVNVDRTLEGLAWVERQLDWANCAAKLQNAAELERRLSPIIKAATDNNGCNAVSFANLVMVAQMSERLGARRDAWTRQAITLLRNSGVNDYASFLDAYDLALRVGRPGQTTAERLAEFRQHSERLIVDTDSIADQKTRALTQAITYYVLSCTYSETPATPRDAEQQLETLLKCLQLFDEFEAYPSSTPTLFVWNCYARNAVRQVSMAVLNKHFDVNLTSWRLTEKEFNRIKAQAIEVFRRPLGFPDRLESLQRGLTSTWRTNLRTLNVRRFSATPMPPRAAPAAAAP